MTHLYYQTDFCSVGIAPLPEACQDGFTCIIRLYQRHLNTTKQEYLSWRRQSWKIRVITSHLIRRLCLHHPPFYIGAKRWLEKKKCGCSCLKNFWGTHEQDRWHLLYALLLFPFKSSGLVCPGLDWLSVFIFWIITYTHVFHLILSNLHAL
jgi:hypothetical protein